MPRSRPPPKCGIFHIFFLTGSLTKNSKKSYQSVFLTLPSLYFIEGNLMTKTMMMKAVVMGHPSSRVHLSSQAGRMVTSSRDNATNLRKWSWQREERKTQKLADSFAIQECERSQSYMPKTYWTMHLQDW